MSKNELFLFMFHLNDLLENDLDCPKVHQTHGLRKGTVLFETQMAALWTSTVWGLLKGQLKSISRWSNHVRPPLKIPNVLGRSPRMSVHIYKYIYNYIYLYISKRGWVPLHIHYMTSILVEYHFRKRLFPFKFICAMVKSRVFLGMVIPPLMSESL